VPLLSLLAPPLCAACREPLPRDGPALCPACAGAVTWLRGACSRCALPCHRGRRCPAAGAAFDAAWAPVAYLGPAAGLVRAMKFGRLAPLADTAAAAIAAGLPRAWRELALVPVPAQPARARRRGYDPAALIARRLAGRTGAALEPCLRRTDRGGRHTRLGRRERHAAVAQVEACAPVPAGAVLVDDVHTTGATLDACARALKRAGTDWVAATTYARTL
jgi:predicted amidophosphoribosyltransferase